MKRGKAGRIAMAVSVAFSLAVSPVMADPPAGRGKPGKVQKHKKHDKGKKDDTFAVSPVQAGIAAEQARRQARDDRYTGYKALPPGMAKNRARGKPLPPGIAKKAVPSDRLHHLPHHAGYEWRMAGTGLIPVAVATGVVAKVCRTFSASVRKRTGGVLPESRQGGMVRQVAGSSRFPEGESAFFRKSLAGGAIFRKKRETAGMADETG